MRFLKNHQLFWKSVLLSSLYEIVRFLWPANACLFKADFLFEFKYHTVSKNFRFEKKHFY